MILTVLQKLISLTLNLSVFLVLTYLHLYTICQHAWKSEGCFITVQHIHYLMVFYAKVYHLQKTMPYHPDYNGVPDPGKYSNLPFFPVLFLLTSLHHDNISVCFHSILLAHVLTHVITQILSHTPFSSPNVVLNFTILLIHFLYQTHFTISSP